MERWGAAMTHDLDAGYFTTETVAAVGGISVNTLGSWVRLNQFIGAAADEIRRPGTGRTRYWTARRALHVAVMAVITRVGIAPRAASELAGLFTDNADTDGGWTADSTSNSVRQGGELLPDGETVLIIVVPASGAPEGRIVRVDDDTQALDVIGGHDPVVTLNLSRMVPAILARLGIAP